MPENAIYMPDLKAKTAKKTCLSQCSYHGVVNPFRDFSLL